MQVQTTHIFVSSLQVERRPQLKATLPKHIEEEIRRRAELNDTTVSQYVAQIITHWYGQGSPAVTDAEQRLLTDKNAHPKQAKKPA